MTSAKKLRTNRANARASTGPKTEQGRARSAGNSLRHALSLPVDSDPAMSEDVELLARQVAGPGANAKIQELARRVAEALATNVVGDLDQPVVRRVRALTALERAVRVEESRLGDVLRVGLVVQDGDGVPVDGVHVLGVEPLE